MAWKNFRETFQSVCEASVDAMLSQLQGVSLEKGENIIEYSRRIVGLVGGLDCAGHFVSKVEQKRGMLRGLPVDYNMTEKAIVGGTFSYNEAVAKLVVRET